MTPITSSNIQGADVDGDDLLIHFNHGAIYRYKGAASEFQPLLDAESAGKFFHATIKQKYQFEKVTTISA